MTEYINLYLDRDDFNDRIGGGIPKGSLMIIEGQEGEGKSIISQRITYGSLINNATVSYISTELNILDFVRQMDSLNYNITEYLLSNKLLFVSTLSLFSKVKDKGNLIMELMKSKSKKIFEKDIIIIDSLSYPLIDNLSKKDVRILIDFFSRIKSMNKILILTFDPTIIDSYFANELRRVADIYFKVGITTIAGSLTRYIEIKRFRNPKSMYNMMIPFRVEPGLGLIIEIVTVV